MATLYLVSRYVYIPVPHLAFHRLLPGGSRLPQSLQLGLTLPACTLPLFVIIAALAVQLDSLSWAALAGWLFASLFTLPVAVASSTGIGTSGRRFLDRAARTSPWLTATLLYGAALVLVLQQVDLDAETLRASLQQITPAGIGLAFLAGFVFSFNPVSFAAIPVVLAYVTRAHEPRRALRQGGAFILGLILTHVVLGVAAALGGDWVRGIMGRQWGLLLGPLLILLGLVWPGWLKLRLPWLSLRARRVSGSGGAFLLAIPFSVAICPFCAPALLIILTASAAIGSVGWGFTLLLAFAVGRSIPILLGAWSMGWLESLRFLSQRQHLLEIIGGILLIASGLYLLNEYFLIVGYS
ncbi:MAG TPA: hypothetical protein ENI96_10125 [Sedimenticola thiotaurini]|uniref:Cytochrome C biogenesis protein transmembrane domain-containing protein n=1 Tax=Sedimenticola thiotaurini TaxID=1543721 RepID=A0A831W7Q2_9GAMM|nr:hypothetical protein [Sedimenticola thiotaurini]